MAFEKGNKYSEKWTLDKVKDYCQDVLNYVQNNTGCRSLTTALTALNGYDDLLCYLQNKYKGEYDFKPIKEAKDICKARLVEQGLDNKVNSTMAIFILKNNHDMADKVETKNDTTIQVPTINITKPE